MEDALLKLMMDYATQMGLNIANKLYARYTPDMADELRKLIQTNTYFRESCTAVVTNVVATLRDYTQEYIHEEIGKALLENTNTTKGTDNDIHTNDGPADKECNTGNTYNYRGVQMLEDFDPHPFGH